MHRSHLCRVESLEARRLFAAVPLMTVLPGSISGTVHLDDVVPDQRWQPDETGIPGVPIELLDQNQKVVAITTTDAEGRYHFADLWPGEYTVRQDDGDRIDGIHVVSSAESLGNDFMESLPLSALPLPSSQAAGLAQASAFPDFLTTPGQSYVEPPVIPRSTANEYIPNSVDGDDYGWRLSVLELPLAGKTAEEAPRKLLHVASWKNSKLRSGRWTLGDGDGDADFGLAGATPLAGDFNGDGRDELALFLAGQWHIDFNGNGRWDEEDLSRHLGSEHDRPIVGDWNNDGKDDIGVFGPRHAAATVPSSKDAAGIERSVPQETEPDVTTSAPQSVSVDHVFQLGGSSDAPIAGDFDGDGRHEIGIFRNGTWRIDRDGDKRLTSSDQSARFGQAGDMPVVGDFDGDGREEFGVFRNGKWIIDSNHNGKVDAADQVFELGGAGDIPIIGDFNGDGVDEPGLYRSGPAARVSRAP